MDNLIELKTILNDSEEFSESYKDILDFYTENAFNNLLAKDVKELYSNIINKYDSVLTTFQREALKSIFEKFNFIYLNVDPNRLKPFEHDSTEDSELLLYRTTESGLINIIINPEDYIAFSFIPYKTDTEKKRNFYFIKNDGDFQNLAFHFFSF